VTQTPVDGARLRQPQQLRADLRFEILKRAAPDKRHNQLDMQFFIQQRHVPQRFQRSEILLQRRVRKCAQHAADHGTQRFR